MLPTLTEPSTALRRLGANAQEGRRGYASIPTSLFVGKGEQKKGYTAKFKVQVLEHGILSVEKFE